MALKIVTFRRPQEGERSDSDVGLEDSGSEPDTGSDPFRSDTDSDGEESDEDGPHSFWRTRNEAARRGIEFERVEYDYDE